MIQFINDIRLRKVLLEKNSLYHQQMPGLESSDNKERIPGTLCFADKE
nr:hypothetical protein [uncultured Bacillus sp.]